MTLGIRTKLLLLFGLLIVVNLSNFFLLRDTEEESLEQQERVAHTYRVLSSSQAFLGHLRDAETGQRGYLLTLNNNYLEPYRSGVSGAQEHLAELWSLTKDNAKQQARLVEISELMVEKFTGLATTIDYADNNLLNEAIRVVKSDYGKELMDRLRDHIQQFDAVERQLLEERTTAYQAHRNYLRGLFASEVLSLLLLTIFISLYLQRLIVKPILLLTHEAQDIASGKKELVIDVKGDDELGRLAGAFKKMHAVITERTYKLQRVSEQLELTNTELEKERDKAIANSITDPITGLYNRRHFDQVAAEELRRAHRGECYLDLLLIDIDHFKKVNDQYGHARGDEVLAQVAQCLLSHCRRPTDFVFRIGGEEFAVLVSGESSGVGGMFAEMLRNAVAALQIPNIDSPVKEYLTISIGVASTEPDEEQQMDELLKSADERLYIAKNLGRDRVVVSDEG